MKISRRWFLGFCSLGLLTDPAQIRLNCAEILRPKEESPDILLEGDTKNVAKAIAGKFEKLWKIAKNPGEKLRVGVKGDDGKTKVITLSMRKDEVAKHPYVVVEEGENRASLLWGIKGLLPSVKFTDGKGETLWRDNKTLEFGFHDIIQALKEKGKSLKELDLSSRDILELGIAAAAIGFAGWLTFTVAKAAIAALSFVAFNLMVLGIVAVGVVVLGPILARILQRVDRDSIKDFASESADRIEKVLGETAAFL